MSQLILRGNEQKDWLLCKASPVSNPRPLEGRLYDFHLSAPDFKAINTQARLLVNQASETITGGESIAKDLRSHMVEILEEHNTRICGYLKKARMGDINTPMHISGLWSQCKIFLSALTKGDVLEEGDLRGLVQCLDQLASVSEVRNKS
jgi:hypothetical protein